MYYYCRMIQIILEEPDPPIDQLMVELLTIGVIMVYPIDKFRQMGDKNPQTH